VERFDVLSNIGIVHFTGDEVRGSVQNLNSLSVLNRCEHDEDAHVPSHQIKEQCNDCTVALKLKY
jgi:hypothetical protein